MWIERGKIYQSCHAKVTEASLIGNELKRVKMKTCTKHNKHSPPPPIPPSARRVSTECCPVVECPLGVCRVPSVGTQWTLGRHLVTNRMTHSVDNTQWTIVEHSVGLVVSKRGLNRLQDFDHRLTHGIVAMISIFRACPLDVSG